MAYFGGIFFANMGGGGGQNYFQIQETQYHHCIKISLPSWADQVLLSKTFCSSLGSRQKSLLRKVGAGGGVKIQILRNGLEHLFQKLFPEMTFQGQT